MEQEVFSVAELAKILKISHSMVNRWLKDGKITGFRPSKNSNWKVTRKELTRYMEENEIPMEFLNGDKIKVLIVDDETEITNSMKMAFTNVKDFSVETANSGFIAGIKLEKIKPDIVILDIYLGDMDGRVFFKHIRENSEFSDIKVIGISGKLSETEIKALYEQGFSAFLQKPFKFEKLKETIFEVIEK